MLNHRRKFAPSFFLIVGLMTGINSQAQVTLLNAPDGTAVEIHRDDYGVPHISGESEIGVFFGQGFAVAQDRLYQLETYRRSGEGKLAEWYGPMYALLDLEVRKLTYTQAERVQIFENLDVELQEMLEAYTAGVNTYLDSMSVNPEQYLPLEFVSLSMETWTVYKSVAVTQWLAAIFGRAGGDELIRLAELQSHGQEWFDQNRPINDPTAPTTIQGGAILSERRWHYSGMKVQDDVAYRQIEREELLRELARQLNLPPKLGSFAVLISESKSASGNAMLLGCPQMGNPQLNQTNMVHEVELNCPTLHAGGMTVAGIPGIIIGHNEHLTWSLTSGISDNSDMYIDSTRDASYSQYYHNGAWLDFETLIDTIYSYENPLVFTHYRTVHGPVMDDDLANHQVYSLKMTFRNAEMEMGRSFYRVSKAQNIDEFEEAISESPMSFNVFCATDDGTIKFWHSGKYQDRSDGVDPRLPHRGDGSEEWGGFIPFEQLPTADQSHQDYFVNWNNKPVVWWDQGDNVPWTGWHPVEYIDSYVGPISSFSFENLKGVPRQISSHGTYQQAVELAAPDFVDANIVPPGQSAFVDRHGASNPHVDDQWPLHLSWEFKDMLFGAFSNLQPDGKAEIPAKLNFTGAYPNPFNAATTLFFSLPKSEIVRLSIFDINGRHVRTLTDRWFGSGEHRMRFDASGLPSGIYFVWLQTRSHSIARKVLLLK